MPERRANRGGIRSGGRRKVDQKPVGRATKVWFAISLLVTFGIIGWSFSKPFRSGGSFASHATDAPQFDSRVGREIQLDPEYKMSAAEYRDHVMQFEDDLLNEYEAKTVVPKNLPSKDEALTYQEKAVKSVEAELAILKELEETDDGFDRNSIEWSAVTNRRKQLADKDE